MSTEIDIEEYFKSNLPIPRGKKYIIRVDRVKYTIDVECMLGKEILELADKKPYTKFQLNQKIHGTVTKIGYEVKVDFTTPGVERFMTLPLDQTEG